MKQQFITFNYKVQNNSSIGECDIFIDGEIVDAETQTIYEQWFDDDTSTSFKSLREEVLKNDASVYNIYINSSGGMVTEAMAIHDFLMDLQNKGKTVNTFGRGLVASAATYILMASKNSTMSENSWFMIHNVSGMAWGDVEAVEKQTATLRKFNNQIRDFYASATGLSANEVEKMMSNETWLTAKEAKEKGFIKNIESMIEFTNSIDPSNWMFKNKEVLAAYNSSVRKMPNKNLNNKEEEMKKFFNEFGDKLIQSVKELFTNKDTQAPINGEEAANKIGEAIKAAANDVADSMDTEITNLVDTKVSESIKNELTILNEKINSLEKANADLKKENEDLGKEILNIKSVPPANVVKGAEPIGKFV